MLRPPHRLAAPVSALAALAALTGLAGLTPARAQAGTTKYTLTLKADNLKGQPDTGDYVQLWSVDNTSAIPIDQSSVTFHNGVATIQLPAGHYFALGEFGGSGLSHPPSRHVVVPQINLTGNRTVTMNEAEASSKITMTTPRPATPLDTDVDLLRTGTKGPAIEIELTTYGPQWFNPSRAKTTVGTFRMAVNQHLESPAGRTGVPYEYTLSYLDPPGIIPAQHYVATANELATVHERFDQAARTKGNWSMGGSLPGTSPNNNADWFGLVDPVGPDLPLPGQLTEYVGGPATMQWSGEYEPTIPSMYLTETGMLLHPGENLTDTWGAYPLHTAANVVLEPEPAMFGATLPSASRLGNALTLAVDPFDDNQPGHFEGWLGSLKGSKVTGTYQVDQNGAKVAGGNAVRKFPAPGGEFYAKATLSPKPSTIRFSLRVARAGAGYPLSNAMSTVWTWHTAAPGAAKVPAGWTCVLYQRVRDCAVQPMLTLNYAVAGLSPAGATKAGPQVLHLTVGHLQAATASAVSRAAVSVSFDGGKTWAQAKMSGSDGHYTATFSAPASTKVTLRTSAGDAAGGSITETIANAYQIG